MGSLITKNGSMPGNTGTQLVAYIDAVCNTTWNIHTCSRLLLADTWLTHWAAGTVVVSTDCYAGTSSGQTGDAVVTDSQKFAKAFNSCYKQLHKQLVQD